MFKILNGIRVPLNEQEIAQRALDEKNWADSENDRLLLEIRKKRDVLLQNCDYTVLPDYSGAKGEWIKYRQALRDITKQENLKNIVWPPPPPKEDRNDI